ncbi:GDSL esterase/lipase [Acorus calamus]|uniref:GDSL esterase/lipase n=1 Tax=Acorus calamus TaxID=4465 RepID=A0AAV9F515_ACOCL|nr:GDSL esterase/lipase [Acorus calamus]
MASAFHPLLMLLCVSLPLLFTIHGSGSLAECASYTSIFSFGDSLTDTGNLYRLQGSGLRCGHPPYGETYFKRPTGRCSNGRLVIDFIAEALGMQTPLPYEAVTGHDAGSGRWGANYAVAGATALDDTFLEEKGIVNERTNLSLGDEIKWFQHLLPSICTNITDCRDSLSKSLFLMGEIGGNDYNHPFMQGKSLDEVRSLAPLVIGTIRSAVETLLEYGATTVVVPGNLPIGCMPIYLTLFQSNNAEDYDPSTGCVKRLNKFSEYHNQLLQMELNRLQQLHPEAYITYADYYNIVMRFYRSPSKFGFGDRIFSACCGGGGPYNYNASSMCALEGTTVCEDPLLYVSWDGIHLTEAAYRFIADALLEGPYAVFPSALTADQLHKEQ